MLAQFAGKCPRCLKPIREQDEISNTEYGWAHSGCEESSNNPLTADHPVCTVCWLTHPPGTCDR